MENQKKLKRRANLLYALRKKGVRCGTKGRVIYLPYLVDTPGKMPDICQIGRLMKEFNFYVQFEIV